MRRATSGIRSVSPPPVSKSKLKVSAPTAARAVRSRPIYGVSSMTTGAGGTADIAPPNSGGFIVLVANPAERTHATARKASAKHERDE
jgi:hypothetical protein